MRTPTASDDATLRRPHRRPLTAGLLLLTVSAVVLGTAAPAQAAAPSRTAVSIATTEHLVQAGGSVTIRGRVVADGAAARGRAVVVQQRTHGTTAWHTFAKVVSARTGRVAAAAHPLTRSKDFRLRVTVEGRVATSAVTTVLVPTSNEITSSSDRTPTAGDAVSLTGRTSAGLAGARVFLQLQTGSGWTSVSSSVVGQDASYTVRAVATAAGDRSYRTIVNAAAGRAAAATRPVDFTVYAWYRLADRPVADPNGTSAAVLAAGRQVIAGTPYLNAIGTTLAEGESSTVAFALQHRCTALRTVIGATDGSDAGFYGVFRARADDAVAVDEVLDKGSVRQLQVDVTGADTLRLTSAALTGGGDPAWGDPEVRCAGL